MHYLAWRAPASQQGPYYNNSTNEWARPIYWKDAADAENHEYAEFLCFYFGSEKVTSSITWTGKWCGIIKCTTRESPVRLGKVAMDEAVKQTQDFHPGRRCLCRMWNQKANIGLFHNVVPFLTWRYVKEAKGTVYLFTFVMVITLYCFNIISTQTTICFL